MDVSLRYPGQFRVRVAIRIRHQDFFWLASGVIDVWLAVVTLSSTQVDGLERLSRVILPGIAGLRRARLPKRGCVLCGVLADRD